MSDAGDVARDLLALPAKVAAATHAVVVKFGQIMVSGVRRRSSEPRTSPRPLSGGSEGPRALTGAHRRGISRKTVRRATGSTTYIGTNDESGAALEFGNEEAFGGTRRTYPYPAFGPELDAQEEPFVAAVGAAAAAVVREDSR